MTTEQPRSPRRLRGALMVALLGATALSGFAAGHVVLAADTPAAQGAPITPAAPAQAIPDFADLVARVKPAVVSITTQMRTSAAADEEGIQTPFGMMRPQHPRAIEARGSGFIIDANGTVVTNNHVVANAKSVSVTLDDGSELPAKIVGRDPRTDIAVLKIDAGHPVPYIQLGNSEKVRVGEWVVAMGNPFGLGGTVTAGIVSARGRDIGSGPYDEFLQIDAPINQGNSGGPLFTQDGRVVGVNTAILSPSGGSIGIGFAIPSNMVKRVVSELETSGHVTRGFIGVSAQAVNPGVAAALHLPEHGNAAAAGALVAGVEPNSPAAKGGVQPGDVITAVDGKPVQNPRDLALDVAGVKPGSETKLDVIRNGSQQSVTVQVATMQNDRTASRGGDNSGSGDEQGQGSVGLALAPLTPDVRSQFDIPGSTKGAVVAQVRPGSPAEQAGIRQGDVIVGVGTQPVASPQDAVNAIHDAARGDKAVALRILRDGQAAFVAVNMGNATHSDGNDNG